MFLHKAVIGDAQGRKPRQTDDEGRDVQQPPVAGENGLGAVSLAPGCGWLWILTCNQGTVGKGTGSLDTYLCRYGLLLLVGYGGVLGLTGGLVGLICTY
jgi:hypothetical protein